MFNPVRLELARQRRRYTAKSLCAQANISTVTLSRIVNGKQSPDEKTIQRLSSALDFPKIFFSLGDVDTIDVSSASFRSLAAMTARERDAAVAAGALAYMMNDWVAERFSLPSVDLLDLSYERDPTLAARLLRQHWSIGERPIGEIIGILETKGVRIYSLAENTKNVDAFSCWRNEEPYVFLNTFKTTERSRFDAVHELGHLVLHRHGGPKQGRQAEVEANAFASSFLMPRADVIATLPFVTNLSQIIDAKKRWGVSALALAVRLHRLAVITDWQYRTFCIQIRQNFGNSEPDGLPPERSKVWQTVLTEMWKEGVSKHHIARQLQLPYAELENLLFGLTGEGAPRETPVGRPLLRQVK